MKYLFYLLLTVGCSIMNSLELDAQEIKPLLKEKFHWGRGQDTTGGYTEAIRAGNVLYISGTVGREVSPEGIDQVYSTLQKVLANYGLNFQHVVKENLYTTDIEAMKKFNAVRKKYYNNDYPAATWVQISRLYMADAKLEVELVAHFPD
jgi:2-iminobutanoate/2-iminopropanoate deaminase